LWDGFDPLWGISTVRAATLDGYYDPMGVGRSKVEASRDGEISATPYR
jgi:hypothetical protein